MLGFWEMQSILSLPSLPGPFPSTVVAPDRVLFMGQVELNCVFMLNWITWNRTVLTFMLNWIVRNGIVFDIETVLALKWIVLIRTVLTVNCV